MPLLSVNIDHVATLRQARYRGAAPDTPEWGEPDVVRAFRECELGGADGITVHLREDRRHITDRDVRELRSLVSVRFNLEMAATDEMVEIARSVRPHSSMLVPEGRMEVTTEGGLDVAGQIPRLKDVVSRLRESGCLVSAFIDAEKRQVDASARCGFDICEVHTGPYAQACAHHGVGSARSRAHIQRVRDAGDAIRSAGMRFNAGHALNRENVGAIARLPGVHELHIGHAIVSSAVFVGLRNATAEMLEAMRCENS
jgi:pyridoxine 5-phosphate synthase